MNRAPCQLPRPSVLAACLASVLLLPGCGSGGGTHSQSTAVAPPSPPAPPPPPPPVSRSLELPTAPARKSVPVAPAYTPDAADVSRNVDGGQTDVLRDLSSPGRLLKQGSGTLVLTGNARFDGGTTLQQGTLLLDGNLFSNVDIAHDAIFQMWGDVTGDVFNNGVLEPTDSPFYYDNFYDADIFGNYTQTADGLLRLLFGVEATATATPLLTVSGRATLAGRVEFERSEYVPAGGYLEWLIHAYDGVSGQFASWSARPSLFLTGDLRYTANDVYFLATRASTQATMTAAGVGDALMRDTAGRVDQAFGVGDTFARQPRNSLTDSQWQFLRSAASIQRLRSLDQAAATFDSLSGHGHADAAQSLLQQALDEGPEAAAHSAALAKGSDGVWAQLGGLQAGAGGATTIQSSGYDHWLSDRLLLGSRVGFTRAELRYDRAGGSVRDESPTWSLFLRRAGNQGSYLLGDLGFSSHRLTVDRFIDLGQGRRSAASVLDAQATHAYLEAGREFAAAGGRLSPYAALDYASLHAAGFAEAGNTGLELLVQASSHQRMSADAGLRYAGTWRWNSGRWLQLGLDARYRHSLSSSDRMRAAFTGTPEAEFDLLGLANASDGVALGARLLGGGDQWGWLLRYDRRGEDQAMSVRWERAFR